MRTGGLTIFLAFVLSQAKPQAFEWSRSFPSSDPFTLAGITAGPDDGFYTFGYFIGRLTLGSDSYNTGGNQYPILVQHDADGNINWTTVLVSDKGAHIRAAVADLDGNVYVVGTYYGTLTYGSLTIQTGNTEGAGFFAKFNSTGECEWIIALESPFLRDPLINAQGNILMLSSDYPYNTAIANSWLLQYSTEGDLIFKKKICSSDTPSQGRTDYLTETESGDLYVTGTFTGNVQFGNSLLSRLPASANTDGFICKLNPEGEVEWAENIGSSQNESEFSGDLTMDNRCNLFVTGWFSDRSMMGKFGSAGDMVWQKLFFGENGRVFGRQVIVDDGGNSYLLANYFGNITIDGSVYSAQENIPNILICRLDPSGNISWIVSSEPGEGNVLYDMVKVSGNALYFVGTGGGTLTLDDQVLHLSDDSDPVIFKLNIPSANLPPPLTPAPALELGDDRLICNGEMVEIGMSGFSKYLWQDGATDAIRSVGDPGEYVLEVRDHCDNVQADTLVITACYVPPVLELGEDRQLCPHQTFDISLSGFDTYFWQDNSTASTFHVTEPGVYYVTVTDIEGGEQSDTIRFFSCPPPPDLELGPNRMICDGEQIRLAPFGFSVYQWSDGSTAPTLDVKTPGRYSIVVTDQYGDQQHDTVVFTRCPHPDLELGDDIVLCDNEAVILELENFAEYLWQDGSRNSTYTIDQPGLYHVSTTDEFGLIKSDTVRATQCFFIPNFISPNGDGKNDVFTIQGLDESYDYGLTIFNRLGVLIYHSSDYHNDWDGRGAPVATYYYRFVDGKTGGKYKGWVDVRK